MTAAWLGLAIVVAGAAQEPFCIEVVDAATGRGVPLIELRTVHEIVHVTDSQGIVAIDEPELLGQNVYFHMSGHGYAYPKDGFGFAGKALDVQPGQSARIEVQRVNIAERLYRVTGAGIYADSLKVGREIPIREGLLNAYVTGQDSVQSTLYRGQIRLFWGDTGRLAYPLGNYNMPGATAPLPGPEGTDPAVGINLDYATDPKTGFVRGLAEMPGEGPTWIGGLTVLKNAEGNESLHAGYVKVHPGGGLEAYAHGLVTFNDETGQFDQTALFDEGLPLYPEGHTFQKADANGTTHVYFCQPYPWVRARATAKALADPANYEGYTCLEPGTTREQGRVHRDDHGKLVLAWKVGTPPLDFETQKKLIEAGALKPDEAPLQLRNVETGEEVRAHGGDVAWNAHRGRWAFIFVGMFAKESLLGEVYYAEADALEGPWTEARKIVTHNKYTFYNPRHHPFFDQDGGRLLYFEGTYSRSFSGNPTPTPRYDYNQIMYRLDLADPRLKLPPPAAKP